MRTLGIWLVAGLTLFGCSSTPRSPSTAVYLGKGQSFDQYQIDAERCREYAGAEIARASGQWVPPAVKTGVVTGLLGAATGAAIGAISGRPGGGAAIGAATGVTAGTGIGAMQAGQTGDKRQRQFDQFFGICMDAKGHRVPGVIR